MNSTSGLQLGFKAQGAEELDVIDFQELLAQKVKLLDIPEVFLERQLNTGFSGGEKRNEILQMRFHRDSILDETDSGLDVDSLRIVAAGVNTLQTKENAVVLITHYERLLKHIVPDFVHVLSEGKIVASGDKSLAMEIEKNGYENIESSLG